MAKYTKGGMTFQSKEKLINYIRYVLRNQELNKPLEGKWFDVLDDVLKGHENYNQKVGNGSYKIGVQICPVNPKNRHFIVIREDGSVTDFSFYKALTTKTHSSEVKSALRAVVKDQVVDYKKEYFEKNAIGRYCICPETGLKITMKTSHLDHYPKQFDEIVADWLKENKLKIKDIELEESKDNDVTNYLTDKSLAESFYNYHLRVAQYRVVLAQVNLQRKKAKGLEF